VARSTIARGQYEALLEHAAEALLVIEQGRPCYEVVNAAAERLLGFTREELLELGPDDLMHPAEAPRLAQIRAQLAAQGWWQGEWGLRRKDGSLVHTEATLVRVAVEGRMLTQGLFRNSTDWLLEDALLKAHDVQHELNNQLALTTGYAELLAQDPRLPPDLLDAAREALIGGLGAVEAGKRLIACFAAVKLSGFRRQRKGERAAVPKSAFRPHSAPVRLDDQPRDVQAQPQATDVGLRPRATTSEPLKQT
jgi:PAS domain S-box-containing protein